MGSGWEVDKRGRGERRNWLVHKVRKRLIKIKMNKQHSKDVANFLLESVLPSRTYSDPSPMLTGI